MTEGHHENNPEYESSVINFDRRYALCIHRHHFTVASAGGGIRASIFNRSNDAKTKNLRQLGIL